MCTIYVFWKKYDIGNIDSLDIYTFTLKLNLLKQLSLKSA